LSWVFDGHLDLAMNALAYERDQALPVAALRAREAGGVADGRGVCSCSLDAMRRGGVRVCLATLLARAKPWVDPGRALGRMGDWPSPDMAHAVAAGYLAYYDLLARRGQIVLLRSREALAAHVQRCAVAEAAGQAGPGVGVIVTMEGADAITHPDELGWWHARGLRALMLAHFGKSHYAHGTPSTEPSNTHDVDGPLTDLGRTLLQRMAELGMPLDLTHLSDQGFADAAERFDGAIYASHSSCRALVPANDHVHPHRMLTDAQIATIAQRGGVVGLPMFNAFLKAGYTEAGPKEAVTFAHVADHIDHICQLTGGAAHVAIGSDADGGFGAEHMPADLDTVADMLRLGDVLTGRGYGPGDVGLILHGNWLNFFSTSLPSGA